MFYIFILLDLVVYKLVRRVHLDVTKVKKIDLVVLTKIIFSLFFLDNNFFNIFVNLVSKNASTIFYVPYNLWSFGRDPPSMSW